MNDKKLTLEERVDLHRRMAENYHNAYDEKAVKEGANYNEWVFAVKQMPICPISSSEI